MLTTDGISFSAKSAKHPGTDCELDSVEKQNVKIIDKIINLIFFILVRGS